MANIRVSGAEEGNGARSPYLMMVGKSSAE